jgi:hypothetical protein
MAHLASAASRQGSDGGAAGESKADKGSAGGGTQLRVLIQVSDAATAAATIVLTVPCASSAVAAIKAQLAKQCGIPSKEQRLIFKGQEIQDDEILAVAGMSDGSPQQTLVLLRRKPSLYAFTIRPIAAGSIPFSWASAGGGGGAERRSPWGPMNRVAQREFAFGADSLEAVQHRIQHKFGIPRHQQVLYYREVDPITGDGLSKFSFLCPRLVQGEHWPIFRQVDDLSTIPEPQRHQLCLWSLLANGDREADVAVSQTNARRRTTILVNIHFMGGEGVTLAVAPSDTVNMIKERVVEAYHQRCGKYSHYSEAASAGDVHLVYNEKEIGDGDSMVCIPPFDCDIFSTVVVRRQAEATAKNVH